ncbi:MAG: DUF2059 domain-containing protein [Opitutae bacterium]|nr:DUF2059 domain-containing protein [Opitutae bacterium]
MKTLRLLLLFLALAAGAAAADPGVTVSKAQDAEIRRMLRLTGMSRLLEQVIGQMIESFKGKSPEIPADVWDKLRAEMDVEEAINNFVPLYAKYYSAEDLRAINDFYETPAGRRLLEKMPQLMAESMTVGEQWGQQVAKRVQERIEAELKARHEAAEQKKDKV